MYRTGLVEYSLACSAGVFFQLVNVFASESAMLKLQKRGGNGASQGELGREAGIEKRKHLPENTVKMRNSPPN